MDDDIITYEIPNSDGQVVTIVNGHLGQFPEEISNIVDSAFANCQALRTVRIPTHITRIGNSAFANCTNLITVEWHNNITHVGDSAFANCSSLTNVSIYA